MKRYVASLCAPLTVRSEQAADIRAVRRTSLFQLLDDALRVGSVCLHRLVIIARRNGTAQTRNDLNIRTADVSAFSDPECLLEYHGIHIRRVAASPEAEIRETVNYVLSVVDFNALYDMRMMSDYEIRALVDRQMRKRCRRRRRRRIQLIAPVEGYDDYVRALDRKSVV